MLPCIMVVMTFLARWSPAAAIAIAIFWLSHQSRPPGAGLAPDYIGHFVAYAAFAFAVVWGMTNCLRELSVSRLFFSWVLVVCYALSDEFHQGFIPGRHPSFSDIFVDVLATSMVVLFLGWYAHRRRSADRRQFDWPPRPMRPPQNGSQPVSGR